VVKWLGENGAAAFDRDVSVSVFETNIRVLGRYVCKYICIFFSVCMFVCISRHACMYICQLMYVCIDRGVSVSVFETNICVP
jgi:hypothetical protein